MDRPFGIGKAIADPLSSGDEVIAGSAAHINEYLFEGGPDMEKEDIELGEKFGVGEVVGSDTLLLSRARLGDPVRHSEGFADGRRGLSFVGGANMRIDERIRRLGEGRHGDKEQRRR